MSTKEGLQAIGSTIKAAGVITGVSTFFAAASMPLFQPYTGIAGTVVALAASLVPAWIVDRFSE